MQYGNHKEKESSKMTTMFKSYYVVWKLAFFMTPAAIPTMFKSYYVVWKPQEKEEKYFEMESLNRTMQYGNPDIWKGRRYWQSLNRTMQYGNMFEYPDNSSFFSV